MPIQRDTPRESVRRTLLYHFEKTKVTRSAKSLLLAVVMLAQRRSRVLKYKLMRATPASMLALVIESKVFRQQLVAILACINLHCEALMLKLRRSWKSKDLMEPDDFTDVEFVEQFRFRKPHFFRILACLRDFDGQPLVVQGHPIRLRIGHHKHAIRVRADKALMVLLRRLSYPCRWCDLQLILGGSRTELSDTYNYMLQLLYDRYSPLTKNLWCWRHQFHRFAAQLRAMGCPHDNLMAIFDGHFQPTTRPGGDACINENLWDHQTFSGKERQHGLKYQACVFPNGMCCVWGPWRGTEHDATMFSETEVIEILHQWLEESGEDLSGYGDSAYPIHRHMQRILRAPDHGSLTRLERRYNALMARYTML